MLRSQVRRLRNALSADELSLMSARLAARLENHPRFREAGTVLIFHSLPDEPGTHDLLARWADRKTLLLPVVRGEAMELHRYSGPDCLRPGAFGIGEPQGEPFTDFAAIRLAVVPGVAFDRAGHRLGRGRGYYDRFFAAHPLPAAWRIGYCFPFQLVPAVPAEPHDRPVHEVLTLSPPMQEDGA